MFIILDPWKQELSFWIVHDYDHLYLLVIADVGHLMTGSVVSHDSEALYDVLC
jgi:hypothetical protein